MGEGINGSGEVLIVYLQGCRALSEYSVGGNALHLFKRHFRNSHELSRATAFFLGDAGKEGRLGEVEDEKRTWGSLQVELRGKEQNTERKTGIRDIGSNQGSASSCRYFLVFCSYYFSLLWTEGTKDPLSPLWQELSLLPRGGVASWRRDK